MLDDALYCGISEKDFWEMTYGEVVRVINAFSRRFTDEQKEKAMFDYTLAHLFRYLFSEEPIPPIEKVYPGIFDEQTEATDTTVEKFKAQLKMFAKQHNAKINKEGTNN